MTSINLLYNIGTKLNDDLEGWDGREGRLKREEIYLYIYIADSWQKLTYHCKATVPQFLKMLKNNKNK